MEPETQIANLKQQVADLKAEMATLRKGMDTREADNKALRDEVRDLKAAKVDLEGKLPAKDAIVLVGDDAKLFENYKELGKPDFIKIKLEDYDRATTKLSALERDNLIQEAAQDPKDASTLRYNPNVLKRLLKDVAVSKGKDGFIVKVGDEEKALDKWIEEELPDFLPALQPESGTPALQQVGNRTHGSPKLSPEKIADKYMQDPDYQSF